VSYLDSKSNAGETYNCPASTLTIAASRATKTKKSGNQGTRWLKIGQICLLGADSDCQGSETRKKCKKNNNNK